MDIDPAMPTPPTYEETLAFLLAHVGEQVDVTIGASPGGGAPCVSELGGMLLSASPHPYAYELDRNYEGTEVLVFFVGTSARFVVSARDFADSEWLTESKLGLGFCLGPVSVAVTPRPPEDDDELDDEDLAA